MFGQLSDFWATDPFSKTGYHFGTFVPIETYILTTDQRHRLKQLARSNKQDAWIEHKRR